MIRALVLVQTAGFWSLAASGAPAGIVRPRLITGSEAELASRAAAASGPSLWLLWLAVLIMAATLCWWAWWAVRYRSAVMSDSERAFRRLSRIVGLSRSERESLRARCGRAGIDPLAALGSPSLAATALDDDAGADRRLKRLRTRLCDTASDLVGTHVA